MYVTSPELMFPLQNRNLALWTEILLMREIMNVLLSGVTH